MLFGEEYRTVKSEVKEILETELPEGCLTCPTRGANAAALAIAMSFAREEYTRERALEVAHTHAEVIETDCSLGSSVTGSDFPHARCNFRKWH